MSTVADANRFLTESGRGPLWDERRDLVEEFDAAGIAALQASQHWTERQLESLCLGVPPDIYDESDRIKIDPDERQRVREAIARSCRDGALVAVDTQSAAGAMYGSRWQILSSSARRWASARFGSRFPAALGMAREEVAQPNWSYWRSDDAEWWTPAQAVSLSLGFAPESPIPDEHSEAYAARMQQLTRDMTTFVAPRLGGRRGLVNRLDLVNWARAEPQDWTVPQEMMTAAIGAGAVITECDDTSDWTEAIVNGHLIDWEFWVEKMPKLSAHQATQLMAGLDPHSAKAEIESKRVKAMAHARRLAVLANAHGVGDQSPGDWLAWADDLQERVHGAFRRAVEKSRDVSGSATTSPVSAAKMCVGRLALFGFSCAN